MGTLQLLFRMKGYSMADMKVLIGECPLDACLAEDVINDVGVVVLKAGSILTEKILSTLSKYGVDNIVIKKEEKINVAEIEERIKQTREKISKRMRKCEMTKEMVSLKQILVNYHCRGLV